VQTKIYLIGLPGSGKTTLGKQVAMKLQADFIDLDSAIEQNEGKSIAAIFKERGEDAFRQQESDLLHRYATSASPFVMATGGGAPCFFSNMDVMNASGVTVFLNVPATEIARRLATALHTRPLFSGMDSYSIKDHVEFLRSQRLPFYKKAKYHIKGKAITVDDILTVLRGT
jgi:shikimate kinase